MQGRIVLALMLREARTRYGRRQAGYLWALVEPVIHISVLYMVFHFALRMVPIGQSLALFLATGLSTYLGFANVLGRTGGGYASNEALLAYPIVKVMDVFMGRALLELATWVSVTFLILGSLVVSGAAPLPRSVLTIFVAMLALFMIAAGVGICIGILGEFFPSIASVLKAPLRILYFTSGVFFLPDSLPPLARDILYWNPVMHGITLFRIGYYPSYESHLLDLNYLFGWAIGSVLAALVAERVARKALRSLA